MEYQSSKFSPSKVLEIDLGNMGLVLPTYLQKWTTSRLRKGANILTAEGVDVKTEKEVVGMSAKGKQVVIELQNTECKST
jgi:hypothetical protein